MGRLFRPMIVTGLSQLAQKVKQNGIEPATFGGSSKMTQTEFDIYADENKPAVKFYGHIWLIHPPDKTTPRKWNDRFRLYVHVESDGLIGLESHTHWFGKHYDDTDYPDRQEIYEYLVEWELAEWRRIGPEDSELFATKLLDPELGLE